MTSYEALEILGLEPSATAEQVKKAFHKLAHIHHPDKGGDPEAFKELAHAYDTLRKNPALGLDDGWVPDMDDEGYVEATPENIQWLARQIAKRRAARAEAMRRGKLEDK